MKWAQEKTANRELRTANQNLCFEGDEVMVDLIQFRQELDELRKTIAQVGDSL
ncbi:MAG: hypothetical protein ACOX6S_10045 [Clostridia bacterium]